MGKSIRSKRKKRLRSLKRELVEGYYAKREEKCQAVLAAAAEAPPCPIFVTPVVEDEDKPMSVTAEAVPIDLDARDPVEGRLVSELLKIRGGVKIGKKKTGRITKKMQKKLTRKTDYPV